MKYNFDEIIDRCDTDSVKYDDLYRNFGTTDVLPMWVADMDFKAAPQIVKAAEECCKRAVSATPFVQKKPNRLLSVGWVGDIIGLFGPNG